MIAWISLTPWAIKRIEGLSYNYIKMNCSGGKCYGVLAVSHFALYAGQSDPEAGSSLLLCPDIVPHLPQPIADRRTRYSYQESGHPERVCYLETVAGSV